MEELQEALARMSLSGGDSPSLEAKTFSEFSSSSLEPSLSVLANLPGGGTILLGIDERHEGLVVGVDNPHNLAGRVANLARNGLSVPVSVQPHIIHLGDSAVVAVNVTEASINDKPVSYQEKAYVRQYDGDYLISLQERQQFLRRHERPRDDRMLVAGTSIDDLNSESVKNFAASVRRSTPALAQSSE